MVARFAIEFLKATAIIVALPLVLGNAVALAVLFLSDRDIGGTYGAGLAGYAAGAFGLIIAIVIVVRRIADIED